MADLTVLLLISERPASVAELLGEIRAAMAGTGWSVEYVAAVEPWFQELATELRGAASTPDQIKVLVAAHRMGETGLVRMALPHCTAPVLLIVPAYYRVEPAALPGLVRALEEADLVVARRWPRRDSPINRLQTRVFHRLTRWFTGIGLRDIASGVRTVRREVLEDVPLYGDLYRFLPVLAARDGYRVREVDAPQHPADTRARVYRPSVYFRRLLDLLGLYFLVRFREKPLRFFGLVGALLAAIGAVLLVVLFFQRVGGQGIADRPVLLLGVLLVVLGVQAIALGLVGEIIVHVHAARFRRYRLNRSTSA